MERVAILASGSGSNAQRLTEYFAGHATVQVTLIGCDRPEAGVVQRAWDLDVPCHLFSGADLRSGALLRELRAQGITTVVLAGFLRLIPSDLIRAFPERIVNIHPSLLPKYGGKGMYGDRVHQAVVAAGEVESGITIHYVNERFDEGAHIAQFKCPVLAGDTPDMLAARIHMLEHAHYPIVLDRLLRAASDQ